MKTFSIYGLHDPDTGCLRYIGASVSPKNRKASHRSPTQLPKMQFPVTKWIANLKEAGKYPVFKVLAEVALDESLPINTMKLAFEKAVIHYIGQSSDLLNVMHKSLRLVSARRVLAGLLKELDSDLFPTR